MDQQTDQGLSVALFIDGSLHAGARPGGRWRLDLTTTCSENFTQGAKNARLEHANCGGAQCHDCQLLPAHFCSTALRIALFLLAFQPQLQKRAARQRYAVKVMDHTAYPSLSHTTKNLPNVPAGTHYAYNTVRE